jgi:SAM-dependent methyltransferase
MKDNFSEQSELYSKFRPDYPDEMVDFILKNTLELEEAWDAGTGNGQLAHALSMDFKTVFATDISSRQLENSVQRPNITYKTEPAEQTSFSDHKFDLITVAQAIHWFDFDKFYQEVKRTLKPEGIIAVVGYNLLSVSREIDEILSVFYSQIVGRYWEEERKYIDDQYKTIPFPFDEIKAPEFSHSCQWSLEQLMGYLNTWSAVQHFIEEQTFNPTILIEDELQSAWGDSKTKKINFPILLRLGKQLK